MAGWLAGLAWMSVACQSGNSSGQQMPLVEAQSSSIINLEVDKGPLPYVLDIEAATLQNMNYRTVHWTGANMQLVFMTLKPGEIIDLEIHQGHDQFLRIEQGNARVWMGMAEDNLDFDQQVSDDWAILIPAGYWHKVENIGDTDLKLYTLYGPPEHAPGKIHATYDETKVSHE